MTKNSLLVEAEKHCQVTGARLTPPRRSVLDIIASASKPLGAYDIIEKMPAGTKPPTVYRALEFWEKEGFLHRISSLNLYSVCKAGHRHDGAQFLICTQCGNITESHICTMPVEFATEAKKKGFSLKGWFLELRGLCKSCDQNATATSEECRCSHHH